MVSGSKIFIFDSLLAKNSAIGTGRCAASFDDQVRCPIVFGGGILAANSAIFADNLTISSNSVSCVEHSAFGCKIGGPFSALFLLWNINTFLLTWKVEVLL